MMIAVPLPIKAAQKDEYSNLTCYRLMWTFPGRDGKDAHPPEMEHGIYRKVNSKRLPAGIRSSVTAFGPDGKINGEPARREQAYARWTAGELILRPLLPAVESPSGESGNPMKGE